MTGDRSAGCGSLTSCGINLANPQEYNFTRTDNSFTLMGWGYHTSNTSGNFGPIIMAENIVGAWRLGLNPVGTGGSVFEGRVKNISGSNLFVSKSAAALNLTWHHYAMTYNDSTLIGYFDGVEVDRDSGLSGPIGLGVGTEPVAIGNDRSRSTIYDWDGYIDDVMIFNYTLTAGNISQIYNETFRKLPYSGTDERQDFSPIVDDQGEEIFQNTTARYVVSKFGLTENLTSHTNISIGHWDRNGSFGYDLTLMPQGENVILFYPLDDNLLDLGPNYLNLTATGNSIDYKEGRYNNSLETRAVDYGEAVDPSGTILDQMQTSYTISSWLKNNMTVTPNVPSRFFSVGEGNTRIAFGT
jgi:hypothetical protein